MTHRFYLGLSGSFHDSALALVDPAGEVVFAEATERYLQYKRALNVAPDLHHRTSEVLKNYCDRGAEIVIAHTWSEDFAERARANVSTHAARRRNDIKPPEI